MSDRIYVRSHSSFPSTDKSVLFFGSEMNNESVEIFF